MKFIIISNIRFINCTVYTAAKAGKTILLDPLPWYVPGKCCTTNDHIINHGGADYSDTIKTTVRNAHRLLAAEAAATPEASTVDPLEGF